MVEAAKRTGYHVRCFAADGECGCAKFDPSVVTLLSKWRLVDDALAVIHANYNPAEPK